MIGVDLLLTYALTSLATAGASNGFSSTSSPFERPRGPVFISEPESRVAFANTLGVTIPCTAYGIPAPALEWIIEDGTAVDNVAGLLEILPNNTLHFLPFPSNQYNPAIHSRTYRCVASNTAGAVVSRNVSVRAE